MQISPLYIFESSEKKIDRLLSFAMKDDFFAKIIYDLIDYGYEINFSFFCGAGAYKPFALSTEKLDTAQKQQQFSNGFLKMSEAGRLKAKIQLSLLLGAGGNAHSFLHEIMHFYQDMHGLYLAPLQEQGVFPNMLDAKSNVVAIMFCEAWAQIEAIRSSWALREKGDDIGWSGAIKSPDWRELALVYDKDLQEGIDEKCAAANIFYLWYKGKHREFYERHGLKIHEINLTRFKGGVKDLSDKNIGKKLCKLELPMLIARLPKGGIPDYFSLIDWGNDIYSSVKTSDVMLRISELEQLYGAADNLNIQDIKCGSPPYLWNRLRMADIEKSEVPPH